MPPKRIDTHAHFIPPFWNKACEEAGKLKFNLPVLLPKPDEYAQTDVVDGRHGAKKLI